MKPTSLITLLSFSLMLGAACIATAACRGDGEPAPPRDTSTPVSTETPIPLPSPTSTPPSPHIDTWYGRFEIAGVDVQGMCLNNDCRCGPTGYDLLVVKLRAAQPASDVSGSWRCPGCYVVATADGTKVQTELARVRYDITGSGLEPSALEFQIPEGIQGLSLHVPDNDPVALPMRSVPLTPTAPHPQIRTPLGTAEVVTAFQLDKYPPDCSGSSCTTAREEGHNLVVVRFKVVEQVYAADQHRDSAAEGMFLTAADGTREDWGVLYWVESQGSVLLFEVVFSAPIGAQALTLHVPGNDPVVLPTPCVLATPTP